ncbi:PRC-barrel domain-containing protein [Roseovarius pacificus]|uniref:PRC-barrel domain-containing protein n=1 Tax=Roseovarius pacificus TaxID=337701 RepID=UPI002A18D677|nr:PRC-barrel domain-containing protein [Roseovarius pacificus]
MKRILATTAIVALAASPVLAQTQSTEEDPANQPAMEAPANGTDTGTMEAPETGVDTTTEAPTTDSGDTTVQAPETEDPMGGGGDLGADERQALTAEELEGLAVHDPSGEDVGDISELVVGDSGEITDVVIDVGGFLGIGAKPVAVAFEEVSLSRDGETGTLHASTNYSAADFEAMETWEG